MTKDELKELRENAKLTQEEAARLLKVSIGTYRNWEQGRSKIFILVAKGIKQVFQENCEA